MALVPPTSVGGASSFTPALNSGQCRITADGVAIGSNTAFNVPWTFAEGDATMLSLGVAIDPTPVAAGIYALNLKMQYTPTDTTAARAWVVQLSFDNENYGGSLYEDSITQIGRLGLISLTVAWFSVALSGFRIRVTTVGADTAGSLVGDAYVQRIT